MVLLILVVLLSWYHLYAAGYGGVKNRKVSLIISSQSNYYYYHHSGLYVETGLAGTVEIFGGQEYDVDWIKGDIGLGDNRILLRSITFGVVGADIFNPPGGLFFGLIKYKQNRIRPTFLEQTKFKSFKFYTNMKQQIFS